MTNTDHDSRSIRNLQANAEQGNILSRYQLYQGLQSGKLGTEANPGRASQQLEKLQAEAQQSRFQIESLSLHSFRRYQSVNIEFDKSLTVIVGENGAGKTSIVESVARLLSWFASRFIKVNNSGSHITDSDIHVCATDYAQVAGNFLLNSHTHFDLSLVLPVAGWNGNAASELQAATLLGRLYRLLAESSSQQELPVFAYYPVERNALAAPSAVTESRLKNQLSQRFNAYKDVFREQAKSGHFIEQYLVLNNLAATGNLLHRQQLQRLNQAIENAIPHLSNLHVDRSSGGAEIKLDNFDNRINFAQLSQGQKTLATMVGDLALRMISLNPHMDDPLQASGIALIDEIDLHLHPGLQQQIIPRLQNTFQNLQWIITTHSPHVLSTVDRKCIRIIEFANGQATTTEPDHQTKGVISSSVLEQIMGTHAIPDVQESQWVTQYESLIQARQWDTSDAVSLREELLQHFGANHPVMEDLEGQIRLAQLKQKYADRK